MILLLRQFKNRRADELITSKVQGFHHSLFEDNIRPTSATDPAYSVNPNYPAYKNIGISSL